MFEQRCFPAQRWRSPAKSPLRQARRPRVAARAAGLVPARRRSAAATPALPTRASRPWRARTAGRARRRARPRRRRRAPARRSAFFGAPDPRGFAGASLTLLFAIAARSPSDSSPDRVAGVASVGPKRLRRRGRLGLRTTAHERSERLPQCGDRRQPLRDVLLHRLLDRPPPAWAGDPDAASPAEAARSSGSGE